MDEFGLGKLRNSYFVLRHGETPYQLKKPRIIYPWPEPSPILLTKKGKSQIRAVAGKLKKEHIDLIYSSDISRTRQSAEIVAQELGLKVSFDTRLRDFNFGVYRGRSQKKFYQKFPDLKSILYKGPKQGESLFECQQRIFDFIKDIDKKYKDKKILIVGHGGPLRLLKAVIKGLSLKDFLNKKLENQAIKVGELQKIN